MSSARRVIGRSGRDTTSPRPPNALYFAPYRLDFDAERLWCGDRPIALRPKTWAVLCYLAERPGELVTKEDLLDAVWTGIAVSEGTLTKSVGEIREALDDDPKNPRFLETVHRRGFRFLVPTQRSDAPSAEAGAVTGPLAVGREAELARLRQHLATAESGTRQIVFITGEAGVGKTTLVESFLASRPASGAGELWIASGQCLRTVGGHEPYMAVLEALGRLARGRHAEAFLGLLRERAPSWLVQLPWLLAPHELDALRALLAGTTPERMLRVFAQLVESLPADVTLLLVLEDIHWADASTLDLISALARRPDAARFLVLATYRPAEVIVHQPALDRMRREFTLQRRATEIALELLSGAEVERYLATRFGDAPPALSRLLHTHTDGNPLYLVTAVDTLLDQGLVDATATGLALRANLDELERHVPKSLAELVDAQLLELDPLVISMLEAGSVAGLSFPAQAVAAAVEEPIERVEDVCEGLVRSHRLLRADGSATWPDQSVGVAYMFTHAVYQRALYDRVPAARRRRLHQRIGERLEVGWGARASEVAPELAVHFERGRDAVRAIHHLSTAAAGAERRFAPREANELFQGAIALLDEVPDVDERHRLEFDLRFGLGFAALSASGFPVDAVRSNFARARELATDATDPAQVLRILYGLYANRLTTGDAMGARELARDLADAAGRMQNHNATLVADFVLGFLALWEGRFDDAEGLAKLGFADPGVLAELACVADPDVEGVAANSWRLWFTGRPEQALDAAGRALVLGRRQPNPNVRALTLFFATQVYLWCGRLEQAQALIEETGTLTEEYGLSFWTAAAAGSRGKLLMKRRDVEAAVREFTRAIDGFRELGEVLHVPAVLAGLGEALLACGRPAESQTVIDDGFELVCTTVDQTHVAELWRVKAELAAAAGSPAQQVESLYRRALEVARAQHARAFELRAAVSLARHLAAGGRRADAHATLRPVYEAFTEGMDTADVTAARLQLEALAG